VTISIDPTDVQFLHQFTYLFEYTESNSWTNCLASTPVFDSWNIGWGDTFTFDNWPTYNVGAVMESEDSRYPYGRIYSTKQKMFLGFSTIAYPEFYSPKLVIEFCYKAVPNLVYLNSSWNIKVCKISSMPSSAGEAEAVALGDSSITIDNITVNNSDYTRTYDLDALNLGNEDFVLVFDRFDGNNDQPPAIVITESDITEPAAFWASVISLSMETSPPGPEPVQYGTMTTGNIYKQAPSVGESAYSTYLQGR
jgi:hypothetical protein